MSAEHERIAEEIVRNMEGTDSEECARMIVAAMAAASARADRIGWHRGRAEAMTDVYVEPRTRFFDSGYRVEFNDRAYTPPESPAPSGKEST